MRNVSYSMSMSLDGYIVGPDGRFDWSAPDEEVFALATEEVRGLGVHLMGRSLYETMLYWETAEEEPSIGALELEFARIWKALPKIVFSSTLAQVEGSNTTLADGTLREEIERLRAEPGGDIAIGGATLAAEAADLDLIDEYLIRVYPVLVGGGIPFFAHHKNRADLELTDTRTFKNGVVHLGYRVAR